MNTNKKTFCFLKIVTVLLGLNLLIMGKVIAQNQTATLDIQPGMLSIGVPRTVSFQKLIVKNNEPIVSDIFLNPFDNMQTIQVIDPSTGHTFQVTLTLNNMNIPPSAMIQEDPSQDIPPPAGVGQPVTVNVVNAGNYFVDDTVVVNGTNEHLRVLSVDTQNNLLTVTRGVDGTDATTGDPIAQGTGLTPQHIVPFSQFKVITLHGNNQGQSVDTSSTLNNPAGTNNVSSSISYYYNPATSTGADYTDPDFLQSTFIPNSTDPDPTAVNSVSAPITLMERRVNTPSVGIYSVGLLLRATIPAGNPGGDYSGELTFTLDDPYPSP